MLKSWKVIKSTTVVDNKWLQLESRVYLLPNGIEVSDYFIAIKPDVVVIVPFDSDKQTLIMKEWERGREDIGYKFPAGRVNDTESPEDAARREFLEETGFEIGELELLSVLDADPGWITTKVYIFAATGLKRVSQASPEPEELYESKWVSFAAIGELIQQAEVHNIFVVSAYHLAEKNFVSRGLL